MTRRQQAVHEVLRGLDGLVTLNEWEGTLIRDLRDKANHALRLLRDEATPPTPQERDQNG